MVLDVLLTGGQQGCSEVSPQAALPAGPVPLQSDVGLLQALRETVHLVLELQVTQL